MNSDAAGICQSLLATPCDAGQWNVYADWLADNGFSPQSVHVKEIARLLHEEETIVRRFIALRASVQEADDGHREFWEALYAQEEDDVRDGIDCLIRENEWQIYDSEEVAGAIADTNASGYQVEGLEIGEIFFFPDRCEAEFTYAARGEQIEDRMPCGDTLAGSGRISVTPDGSVSLSGLTAQRQFDEDYHDDYDEEGT